MEEKIRKEGLSLFRFTGCSDVDWSQYIKLPTWKVSSKPKYDSWIDGNGTEHRDIYAYKISGTFTLLFEKSSMYYSFFERVIDQESKNNGYVPIRVYDNRTNDLADIYAYISFDPKDELPLMDGYGMPEGFEVTIEER